MNDIDVTSRLSYDGTQQNISSDELLQPFESNKFTFSNNQSETCLVEIYTSNDVIPQLLITDDAIILEKVNTNNIREIICGNTTIELNRRMQFDDRIYISYLGTGAGEVALNIKGRYLKSGGYDMSKELEQIHQVSKDARRNDAENESGLSAGSEYYKTRKSSTTPKQVGLNPY